MFRMVSSSLIFFLLLMVSFSASYANSLPKLLNDNDVELYKKIFHLQEMGYMNKSDFLISKLENKLLVGNLLSQRYLHPTAYISKFSELKDWLEKYQDHPSASRIYWLSKRKKPKSQKNAKKPTGGFLSGFGSTFGNTLRPRIPITFKGRSAPSITRNIAYSVRKNIRRGWPSGSLEILKSKNAQKYLTNKEKAQLHWEIANAYFIFNKDLDAVSQSAKALILSDGLHQNAWFTAGIASWRKGDFLRAKIFFENLANLESANGYFRASGAYWASRIASKELKPKKTISFLKIAAAEEYSFYGQLALEALGLDESLNFNLPEISNEFMSFLSNQPGGKRAFAFIQLKYHWYADRELRRLYEKIPEEFHMDLMSFAARFNLPSLAYRIADLERRKTGVEWLGALYPDLYLDVDIRNNLDIALIHSIIRQESRFDQRGKSPAKAQGLMQILPSTASFVTKNNDYKGKLRYKLLLKNINISIGNKYIKQLLNEKVVSNNIIHLLASYNGGPGNFNKWKKKLRKSEDYLLLIESIPSRETRWYIKSVLKNVYVYRSKYNQTQKEAKSIASGFQPLYEH